MLGGSAPGTPARWARWRSRHREAFADAQASSAAARSARDSMK
jgi:hypothetical protein